MKKHQLLMTLIYTFCITTCLVTSKLNASAITLISAAGDVSVAKANATLSTAEAVGVGEVSYSWSVDKDETRQAESKALQNAVESWVVTQHKAHYSNYKKVKDEIDSDIKSYVLGFDIIDTEKNKESKTVRITLRAKINEVKMLDKLISLTDDQSGNAYITFVFVAREHAGSESYSEQSSSITKGQKNNIEQNSSNNQSAIGKSQTQTVSTNTRNKEFADEVVWRVATTNEVDVAMGDVFTNANFNVIDAGLLEEETGYLLEVKNFIKDYERGDDLTSVTKSDALKGLKGLEDPVEYLAIGTLDIDKTLIDSVTGNYKVPVSVTAQVLAVLKRGSAVAKVGPVQYFGMGPTVMVARNNALKLAAEDVANTLVAKLSAKTIR
ncbi:hypothetical protein [Paraglaciecola hydrolytica]|uniref:Curli production assembly/transport component CsgG n=1 Tax=Paraglaciecola hydrolytica TaxID=1799789 RepID=A0A136A226_9ALTE|nr:hypothetical protein [Paraglaciecola hydrolytica]KXI29247.1 hypothetical protein AX660_13960 [Paraglaciecola hydrolytica]